MRLDVNFVDHVKVKRLIREAGYESFYGLVRLFSVATKMYCKGIFKDCTELDIEDFADWRGEEGKLIETLVKVGFLDKTDQGYEIHEWKEHQPWVYHADARSEQAKKAVETRWAKKNKKQQSKPSDTDSIRSVYAENTDSNTPLPSPSPIPSPIHSPKPKKDKRKVFSKPTLLEVGEYCKERKNNIDAQHFIDYYDSKGWVVGNSPMKDWKASVRTWERRKSEFTPIGNKSEGKPFKSEFDLGVTK